MQNRNSFAPVLTFPPAGFVFSRMQFSELNLNKALLEVLKSKGYNTPTPIQQQAIPPVMNGDDVLGLAQTGTGKTAAFALPILHRLLATAPSADANPTFHAGTSEKSFKGKAPYGKNRSGYNKPQRNARPDTRNRPIRALVLAPTRELAGQINESFRAYGKKTPIRAAAVFGGVSQGRQIHELRSGIDVLTACPGRLLDLMQQGFIRLDKVEYVVLDEADRMLDMGFIPDIRKILSKVPEKRQTLLFSATMPTEVEKLVNDFMESPTRIEIAPVSTPAARVEHQAFYVNQGNKPMLLKQMLLDNVDALINDDDDNRILVFTRTRRSADRVMERLEKAGIRTECIHGSKSQAAREKALRSFRRGTSPVLVATDLAARGLDVSGITHVVNYDLPNEAETFVHRIGRTGRAGASGIAISFCDSQEASFLAVIEKLIRVSLPKVTEHDYHCEMSQTAHERIVNRAIAPPANPGFGKKKRSGGGNFRGGRPGGKGRSNRDADGGGNQWRPKPAGRRKPRPHADSHD